MALSATIAGCSSDDTDSSGGPSGNGNGSDNGTDGSGSDWKETELMTDGADLGISFDRLVHVEEDIGWEVEDAYVEADVENTGDGPAGTVGLEVTWYDETGSTMGSDSTKIATLAAGETWEGRVDYFGTDPGAVQDYDVEVVDETPADPVNLDLGGVTADIDRYQDDTGLDFTADITNERAEPIEFVQVVVKVYDGDLLLDTVSAPLEDLEGGETRAGIPIGWGGGRSSRAGTHEVLFADAEL